MQTIKTLDEVRQLIEQYPGRVYVRWSRYPMRDIRRGYSIDWAAGRPERGLSCVQVTGRASTVYTDPDHQARADHERLVKQLTAYAAFAVWQPGCVCWLLTGDCVGTDSDGCPVVVNAQPLGRLSAKLVKQLLDEEKEIRRREVGR